MRLYVVRHGETAVNAGNIAQGRTDTPLSAIGHEQAIRLASWLTTHDFATTPPTAIYISPLQRTQQTAAPLAAHYALTTTIDPRLIELDFGVFEGRIDKELLDFRHNFIGPMIELQYPNGEHHRSAIMRAQSFLQDMRARHSSNDIIVAVSHGSFLRLFLHLLADRTLEELFQPGLLANTGFHVFEINNVGGYLIAENQTPHLFTPDHIRPD